MDEKTALQRSSARQKAYITLWSVGRKRCGLGLAKVVVFSWQTSKSMWGYGDGRPDNVEVVASKTQEAQYQWQVWIVHNVKLNSLMVVGGQEQRQQRCLVSYGSKPVTIDDTCGKVDG